MHMLRSGARWRDCFIIADRAAFQERSDRRLRPQCGAEMLEAVQMNRQGGSLDGLIDIGADAAQLRARRMLAGMIEAERH
jgi:hypothetical protein